MANYVFDNIAQTDADAFTSADSLYFLSAAVSGLGVVDTAATTTINALGTTITEESITLSSGSKSLTFDAAALASASQNSQVVFLGTDDSAVFGLDASANSLTAGGTAGNGSVVFGFGGADTLIGSAGNDTLNGGEGNDIVSSASTTTETDYLLGGNGADSITGGAGNDHIYGNLFTSTAGAADGNDTINAGDNNDYVNGNAGNDIINGEDGNDRLYGGNGIDTVDGGNGNDYLQGNKGGDILSGSAGNDTIHGGADDDSLTGGTGNDQLFGDLGNDTLVGGAGYDWLTGGNGADRFDFNVGDASNSTIGTTAVSTDVIADFENGTDHIHLIATSGTTTATFVPSAILHTGTGATFTDVAAAQTYAQQLLDGSTGTHGSELAAITVGADTYLFWSDAGTTATLIDQAIKVVGVADSVFNIGTGSDFV